MNVKAQIILADPPWQYKVWSAKGTGRSAEQHYNTMTTADLMQLPVSDIAAPDCALFMWATFPQLPDALALGAAWGFTYKTAAFVWVKQKRSKQRSFFPVEDNSNWFMGLGHWSRSNAELCLLFTRGKPKRVNAGVRQLIVSPVRKHSQKPDEQYGLIETLMGFLEPRVELFARHSQSGWVAYGNAISGVDIREELRQSGNLEIG